MPRILVALTLLACSTNAQAVQVGTSTAFSTSGFVLGNAFDFGLGDVFGARGFAPSLDLRSSTLHFQFHVLEFLSVLADDGGAFIGANGYYQLHTAPVGGAWMGVVQPGLSVDLWADNDLLLGLAAEARVGVEAAEDMGFGVYVVPSLGLAVGDGDTDLIAGGTLQFSAWFGG